MADAAAFENLRPCGRYETFSTGKHHVGFHRRIGVTATYRLSIEPTNSIESLVFAVLHKLISKHSNLSAIALNEEKSYPDVLLVRLPKIDLRTCVEFHERQAPFPDDGEPDEELDLLLEEQHKHNFKDDSRTKPMWRLVVVTNAKQSNIFTATWFFHHVIADGGSAMLFHEHFLAALNSSDSKVLSDPVVGSPSTPLPPPFEGLHPMNTSWPFFLHAILKAFIPSLFGGRPAKLWTGSDLPGDTASIQGPHYRTVVFSKDITNKLTQSSRREKTSVTATLQCLLAASLFTSLPASEYDKLQINGPIAMRRFLHEVPNDQMTNATSLYEYLHDRSSINNPKSEKVADILQYFSWESTRYLKAAIQAEVAKEGGDNPIALLKYVSDMHKFLKSSLGKPRNPSAQVTNLGVYKDKSNNKGAWSIGRMVYSTDAFSTSAMAVSIISGGDGNATLSFCWMENAVNESLMYQVIQGVEVGVQRLVSEELVDVDPIVKAKST